MYLAAVKSTRYNSDKSLETDDLSKVNYFYVYSNVTVLDLM